jgi:hypothetical protein
MKRMLLTLGFALALSAFGSVSFASANIWPLHRHHKDSAAKNSEHHEKARKAKGHREKHGDKVREQSVRSETGVGVTPGPHSVGGRHPQPGPAGAGAS